MKSKEERARHYVKHKEYIEHNGLNLLINFKEGLEYTEEAFDTVSGNMENAFPPEPDDLVRLHKLIRKRKPFTILEFGLGYSTIVMADAMAKNEKEWNELDPKPEIRNRYLFQVFSVDTSKEWIYHTQKKLPETLVSRVHLCFSRAEIGTYNGQLCHYYKQLPDIVPDFIYLDGPFPKDVEGDVNGLSFACDERTVMAADLLLMEPVFLPGTFIIVDGRTNNARFLARNFTREYKINRDEQADITTFELNEERLGKYNKLGSDFFLS
jgi:hypothetical protein